MLSLTQKEKCFCNEKIWFLFTKKETNSKLIDIRFFKVFLKKRVEKNIMNCFLCCLSKQIVANPPMAPHVSPENDFAKVCRLVRKT